MTFYVEPVFPINNQVFLRLFRERLPSHLLRNFRNFNAAAEWLFPDPPSSTVVEMDGDESRNECGSDNGCYDYGFFSSSRTTKESSLDGTDASREDGIRSELGSSTYVLDRVLHAGQLEPESMVHDPGLLGLTEQNRKPLLGAQRVCELVDKYRHKRAFDNTFETPDGRRINRPCVWLINPDMNPFPIIDDADNRYTYKTEFAKWLRGNVEIVRLEEEEVLWSVYPKHDG